MRPLEDFDEGELIYLTFAAAGAEFALGVGAFLTNDVAATIFAFSAASFLAGILWVRP